MDGSDDKKPLIDLDAQNDLDSKNVSKKNLKIINIDSSSSDSDDEPLKITTKLTQEDENSSVKINNNDGNDGNDTNTITITVEEAPTTSRAAIQENGTRLLQQQQEQMLSEDPIFTVRSRTNAVNARLGDDLYESLDYEVCENVLFQEEQKKFHTDRFKIRKDIIRWIIFLQIGIITALIACTIDIVIETLTSLKYDFLKKSVDANVGHNNSIDGDLVIPFLYWLGLSMVPVLIGAAMVTYIEPITAGSGIPQVKCYLNGVKIPKIVRIKTLTIKAIGVITSVVGGLAGGKEGPMIHAGAVVAAGVSQGKSTTFVKDFKIFKAFRDDHEKRDFVLGGAAAGVAAAFGAPIGGMLFSLEEAASFWNQNLIWRTLVASIVSSFTLNIVLSAFHGLSDFTFTGLFNLGKFEEPVTFEYFELPIFMLLGIAGGLLGALWNCLNTRINTFRKRFIKYKIVKIFEAVLIAMLGVTLACILIYSINDCRPLGNDPTDYPVQLFCDDNEYNAVAALWFQTPEATVRSLFHDPPGSHKILSLALFTLVYYLLACFTFGLNVSLGIFIPTALVGAAWGRLFAMVLYYMFPQALFLNHPGKYALIGAAANLGGVLRMTVSLSVILMETTGIDTTFFFPLIVTLISAKWVGDYFNEGIYDTQIKENHVPMLPWEPLPKYMGLKASQIMSSPVHCIKLKDSANYIYSLLKKCRHNGFPVVEDVRGNDRSNGRVCGFILRSQLIVILLQCFYEEKKRFWKDEVTIQTFRDVYPRYPSIACVRMHEDKVNYTVNLDIFMNPSPMVVFENASVPKIFNQFRALGLRHMVVIDDENRVLGIITRKDFLYK